MLAAWSFIVMSAVLPAAEPVTPADPSDPVVVEPQPAAPPLPVDPVEPEAPVEPVAPPTAAPTPPTAAPTPSTTPTQRPPVQNAPEPDPWKGPRNPTVIGLSAAGGACVGALVGGITSFVIPFAVCALPLTTAGGAIAGTAAAAANDGGDIDQVPLFVASSVSVVAGGLAGAGFAAGGAALLCRPDGNSLNSNCGVLVPIAALFGAVAGTAVLGPIAAGVSVAVLGAQQASP